MNPVPVETTKAPSPGELRRVRCEIQGIVQGVGFRPFVYRLATELGLGGYVRNGPQGVEMELEGTADACQDFLEALPARLPPLARVEHWTRRDLLPVGEQAFAILESQRGEKPFTHISPDIATCPACLEELDDPKNRRYQHPFINCTHCGPRFTLITDLPYDREKTTMGVFPFCPACRLEYDSPDNRRFHAEPVACPNCGPRLALYERRSPGGAHQPTHTGLQALERAGRRLSEGAVLAVKGLGGYHLACDAEHIGAVAELRRRKHRDDKPFALMAASLEQASRYVDISPAEAELLSSPARPIVLLRKRDACPAAPGVAPGFGELGLMLPYTPLHTLLLRRVGHALVLTSGNLSDEPIAYQDGEARERLAPLVEGFLTHDREIHTRCDDSVARVWRERPRMIRRSRGYVPAPLRLPWRFKRPVLALGGELKNTFCLLREDQAFLGPHMGDLENAVTLDAFESGIEHFLRLLRTEPEVIVHDLHPDYFSTRHARDRFGDLEILAVQHHHAHIASCLAENGVAEPVLGVAFDGTGLGTDGHLWGGEFLQAGPREFQRLGHLSYFPLPGGAQAIREPWRVAWSLLLRRYGPEAHERAARLFSEWDAAGAGILERMITQGVHTPLSCGAGRLFDAASALITGRRQSRYEGQAAIELEQAADPNVQGADEILPRETPEGVLLESEALLEPVVNGLLEGRPRAELAARFHNTMARSIAAVCGVLSHRTGLGTVALSGGVFQNRLLLERTTSALEQANLKVLTQSRVPANDGGLSLGQAVIGGFRRCV